MCCPIYSSANHSLTHHSKFCKFKAKKFQLPRPFLAHPTHYDQNQHHHEICLIILYSLCHRVILSVVVLCHPISSFYSNLMTIAHVPFLSMFLSSTGFTFSLVQATTSRHQRRQGSLVARQGCGANVGFDGIVSCV